MIFDTKEHLDILNNLSQNFSIARDFILSNDLTKLEYGVTTIVSNRVIVEKLQYDTKSVAELEAYNKREFAVIHLILAGEELIGCLNINQTTRYTPISNYDEKNDIIKCQISKCSLLLSDETNFVVFFPNDVFMPGISTGKQSNNVTKIIIKVRLEK